jgi:hypothetical protein
MPSDAFMDKPDTSRVQGPDYGQQLRALMNAFDSESQAIRDADDMLPGPKDRKLRQLKQDYLQKWNAEMEAIESRMRANYVSAYRGANPVPDPDVVNSPFKNEIVSRLQQGASAAEMYEQYQLQGHDEGLKVLELYGPQIARGTDHEKLSEMIDRANPGRVEARKNLEQTQREIDAASQGITLMNDAMGRRLEDERLDQ